MVFAGCGKKEEAQASLSSAEEVVQETPPAQVDTFDGSVYSSAYDWTNAKIAAPFSIETYNQYGSCFIDTLGNTISIVVEPTFDGAYGTVDYLYTSSDSSTVYYRRSVDASINPDLESSAIYMSGGICNLGEFFSNIVQYPLTFVKYVSSYKDSETGAILDYCEVLAQLSLPGMNFPSNPVRCYASVDRNTGEVVRLDNVVEEVSGERPYGITIKHIAQGGIVQPAWLDSCIESDVYNGLGLMNDGVLAVYSTFGNGDFDMTNSTPWIDIEGLDMTSADDTSTELVTLTIKTADGDLTYDSSYFTENSIPVVYYDEIRAELPEDPSVLDDTLLKNEEIVAVNEVLDVTATWNWKDSKWEFEYGENYIDPAMGEKSNDADYWKTEKGIEDYAGTSLVDSDGNITVYTVDGTEFVYTWDSEAKDFVPVDDAVTTSDKDKDTSDKTETADKEEDTDKSKSE